MTFIANQIMTNNEKIELLSVFKSLDKDGNGILDKNELLDG